MTRRTLLLVGVLLFAARLAAAGEVDPRFAARMAAQGNPNAYYPAIVYLAEQVDVKGLEKDLDRMHATLWFRHYLVVSRLQETARRTQGRLLRLLAELEADHHVRNVRSLWIINALLLEGTPQAIAWIARQPEVAVVYDGGIPVQIIWPFDEGPAPDRNPLDAPEPGITAIGAPQLWALGYRGQGRLVANLDTGVEGSHPALRDRWRGRDPGVSLKEAWFDPLNRSFPTDQNGHGTHTMGIICGEAGSNQIGVAPEAKWIAAAWRWPPLSAFVADVIAAFNWAADPDGNPATMTDVPDAINNSWGLSPFFSSHGVKKCDNRFWEAMDNCEAAGCAVVFAAGNEGSRGAESLRTPADRITTDVNAFAVGALNTDQKTIASFSSRGPSGCDSKTIKPEVCAQGVSVRSAYRGGTYRKLSGTSMAAPHVTGAIVLLRQVWPNVTAQRVKQILLQTAVDLGPPGEDNSYGMGRIDLVRAYNQLLKERPDVSLAVMGAVRVYKMGTKFYAHVSLLNNTQQDQTVVLSLQYYFDGQPTSAVVLPPTQITLPAGYKLDAPPLPVGGFTIPTGLPAAVLYPKTWSLRGEVRRPGGGTLLHRSEYVFSLSP